MVLGVTFVKVVPGKERSVFDTLKGIPGFRELYHVFGEYDFLVIAEVDNLSVLSKTVDKIREVNGVITTQTIVGAELVDSYVP
jgi:DNA-binding Lrp family transcriptional regulator